MSVDKSLPVLHDAHVWAYFRHHPLDPDASLFVAFDEGSVGACCSILGLLHSDLIHRRRVPDGLRVYGQRILEELAQAALDDHGKWQARCAKRKTRVGRPLTPSTGQQDAQALQALHAALKIEGRPDPGLHAAALVLIRSEIKRLIRARAKSPNIRRHRGRPPKHSLHVAMAMDVWAILKVVGVSEAQAIQATALLYDPTPDETEGASPMSLHEADEREQRLTNLTKQVEAAYYALKPYLVNGDGVLRPGMIPLEKLLDD